MFKIVKSATYSAMKNEIADLTITNEERREQLERWREDNRNLLVKRLDLQNEVDKLQAEKEACHAMREDQRTNIGKLRADLAKQGDELVLAKDQLKQFERSLSSTIKQLNERSNQLERCEADNKSCGKLINEQKHKMQLAYDTHQTLINAVQSAITEMRKTRKGRTSLNNIRAFEILKSAIGQK